MAAFVTMRQLRGAAIVGTLATLGTVALAAQSGCGDDEAATTRASRRGEACQVRSDCEEGLYCAPMPSGSGGGLCVTGDFRIAKTTKECALVECAIGADCCDGANNALCAQLRSQCMNDAGPDPAGACASYAVQCGCASGRVDCEQGRCVSHCDVDRDCTGAGRRCAGGKCVQCALDGDCQAGLQCVTGQCRPPCSSDGNCSGFDRCVQSRCVPSGCQTDRECVAATRNVDARCGTNGKCIVPCETDLECGSPTSYSFFSCIDRQCTYVGCETDKDCLLLYIGPSDAASLGPKQTAVCRESGLVGDVVKPAQ